MAQKDRLGEVKDPYEIVEEAKGATLVGKSYEPLYPFLKAILGTDQESKSVVCDGG